MGGACGAYGGGAKCAQGSGGGNLRERDQWGDPDVDGRIILRWIFRKWEGLWGLDGVGSGQRQVAGTCDYGNELSGSIKRGEFLD
jgi:hypothetical protein